MTIEEKLQIAIEALQFYRDESVYKYPDDWSCFKEGREPEFSDCEKCNDVAEEALNIIENEE